ncbi:MAG: phospholipase D-like domain-containing protein [Opitutales bacterium]
MWNWLNIKLFGPLLDFVGTGLLFLLANISLILGLVCAGLIIQRVSTEKRSPSNTFAWLLLVLFLPFIGVPLYLMFGGRKSRKLACIKAEVSKHAHKLSGQQTSGPNKAPYVLAPEAEQNCSKGNHTELLADGKATYERLVQEIGAAQHTIHIATYILGSDKSGRTLTELLAQRAGEGIAVRLLLDSLGSWNCTRLARHKIRAAGGQVAMFMPVLPIQTQTSSNLRNHRKIAIFDNFRAITGGQNLDNRFLGNWPDTKRFADFSVVTQGPAVAELTRTFIADWAFAAKEDPARHRELLQYMPEEAGNSTIEVITSGPDVPNDPLWEQLVRIIQEFKQHLTIITPYFIPDEVLLQSLIVKAHTGRQIRLILPLQSNQGLADIARHRALRQLDAAGVDILFYKPRMLHAKLVLADDLVALIGSANIDMRSLFVNFEIALAHYTAGDIEMLTRWAKALESDCIAYRQVARDKALIPSKLSQDLVHLLVPLL